MEIQTVDQALDWIHTQSNEVDVPSKAQRVAYALQIAGHTDHQWPAIHLTGTNGKGSTVSFLKSLLMSQGLRVGTFTSPFIERFNERIMINHQQISDSEIVYYSQKLYQLNQKMRQTQWGRLAFFELYTVMALMYFADQGPDVCLIEAGIGGLNDSTNAIFSSLQAITSVGIDHAEILGDTELEIGRDKAGILKAQQAAVLGPLDPEVEAAIKAIAASKANRLYCFGQDYGIRNSQAQAMVFHFYSDLLEEDLGVTLSMLGNHQKENASLALELFILWMQNERQARIDWPQALKALEDTQWIGRMEELSAQPLIYIDGAHNEAGLLSLKDTLVQYFPDHSIQLVYGGLATKNQDLHLELLADFPLDQLYLTAFNYPRAISQAAWQERVDSLGLQQVEVLESWEDYLARLMLSPSRDDAKTLFIFTGSLYFISQVRNYIKNKQ